MAELMHDDEQVKQNDNLDEDEDNAEDLRDHVLIRKAGNKEKNQKGLETRGPSQNGYVLGFFLFSCFPDSSIWMLLAASLRAH